MTVNDDSSPKASPVTKKVRGKHQDLTADQRLLRKREAARIRQQRCRARKKETLMQKRLAEATGKQGEELKQELAKIKAAAAASTPKKKDDAAEDSSKAGQAMPMQFPFMMGPFGPVHPMMMQQMMMQQMNAAGQFPPGKNPMECPPDVMGLPAKGPNGEDVKSPEKKVEDDEDVVKETASV